MNHPLISVIVPVYKIELYIQECIDSILAQTHSDFELILVNDGSPDSSGDICVRNAALDSRIRVLHQSNQGVTRARANGVAAATGEFICFVDGDDTIPPHALETLVSPTNDETDIVLGKLPENECPQAGEVPLTEYRKMCVMLRNIHQGPCAKLFRRSLFNDWIFELPRELRIGEDAVMNIRLAYRAQGKIISTATNVYQYRINPSSVTHSNTIGPELNALFQDQRLASIPQEDMPYYESCGLYRDMIYQWMSASCHSIVIPSSVRAYHRFLLKKKNKTLRLDIYTGILFYCTNPLIRGAVIGLRNLVHKLTGKS
mgnify:CR=1 FL=1